MSLSTCRLSLSVLFLGLVSNVWAVPDAVLEQLRAMHPEEACTSNDSKYCIEAQTDDGAMVMHTVETVDSRAVHTIRVVTSAEPGRPASKDVEYILAGDRAFRVETTELHPLDANSKAVVEVVDDQLLVTIVPM